MGHKVNPNILRVGIIKTWNSNWFSAKKNYTKFLHQDLEIKKIVEKELDDCGVAQVEIARDAKNVIINIHTSKPAIIIGRQGKNLDKLKAILEKKFEETFSLNIQEIRKPDLNAKLVADGIARQVEKRIPYRRACKMAIAKAMENGALGAKIHVGGRLNGVEIARTELFANGKIPLHTLRADIQYAVATARTTYGLIGIKVWIYLGQIFKKKITSMTTQIPASKNAKNYS